mgnify:CR=1 FL=1
MKRILKAAAAASLACGPAGAYSGEDNMDDNEDKYGEENRLDDLPSGGS